MFIWAPKQRNKQYPRCTCKQAMYACCMSTAIDWVHDDIHIVPALHACPGLCPPEPCLPYLDCELTRSPGPACQSKDTVTHGMIIRPTIVSLRHATSAPPTTHGVMCRTDAGQGPCTPSHAWNGPNQVHQRAGKTHVLSPLSCCT